MKTTIYKANMDIADIDNACYESHQLTIALHPSETEERMMMRILAFALNAHLVQKECGGDAQITFGAGLSDPNEPDVQIKDYADQIIMWSEVGQPDEKALNKISAKAKIANIYAYGHAAEVWWEGIKNKLSRYQNLNIWQIKNEQASQLAAITHRSMQLQITIIDSIITITSAGQDTSITIEPTKWK